MVPFIHISGLSKKSLNTMKPKMLELKRVRYGFHLLWKKY